MLYGEGLAATAGGFRVRIGEHEALAVQTRRVIERQAVQESNRWTEILDFENIKNALGLSTASLIAFIVGVVCVIAAVMTGMIYSANTLVRWQAVQTWRIEWMLAAIVAFVAGILLKKQ